MKLYEKKTLILLINFLFLLSFNCQGMTLEKKADFSFKNKIKQIQKIKGTDVQINQSFGNAIASSNDYVIIGAYGKKFDQKKSGGAYLLKKQINHKLKELKIISPYDGESNDYFAYSVSISDKYILIGAPGKKINGVNIGAAYLYKIENDKVMFISKIEPHDKKTESSFGKSVAIYDKHILIGAPGAYKNNLKTGATYLYELLENNEIKPLIQISPDSLNKDDFFGCSVSMSDGIIVIGANGHDDGKIINKGAVYVYELNNDRGLKLIKKLTASDKESNDYFGSSVSNDGKNIIIGADFEDSKGIDSGSAYIYEIKRNKIVEIAKIQGLDTKKGDLFGSSVSVSGNLYLVGSFFSDIDGSNSVGLTYLFQQNGDDVSQIARIKSFDQEMTNFFGYAVNIKNKDILIGAIGESSYKIDSGAIYKFILED